MAVLELVRFVCMTVYAVSGGGGDLLTHIYVALTKLCKVVSEESICI